MHTAHLTDLQWCFQLSVIAAIVWKPQKGHTLNMHCEDIDFGRGITRHQQASGKILFVTELWQLKIITFLS